jgi:hypothetical protein
MLHFSPLSNVNKSLTINHKLEQNIKCLYTVRIWLQFISSLAFLLSLPTTVNVKMLNMLVKFINVLVYMAMFSLLVLLFDHSVTSLILLSPTGC